MATSRALGLTRSKLLSTISLLLSTAPSASQQLYHSKAFLVISRALLQIQIKLYYYLASDFLSSANLMLPLQRCATVVEVLHAVKMSDIVTIRAHLLTFVSRMICMVDSKESELNRDNEFNALLNFIATVHEVSIGYIDAFLGIDHRAFQHFL
ncbi:unnamed protein product [Gongylonema pulchrum]|uniref:Secreted protein n=1 Tax=Gongylonema pulchrum TaxID=637853 RepID=A0A183EPS6_9BILA|nr:unnamed protein product [Gongylonema pulchrum]